MNTNQTNTSMNFKKLTGHGSMKFAIIRADVLPSHNTMTLNEGQGG